MTQEFKPKVLDGNWDFDIDESPTSNMSKLTGGDRDDRDDILVKPELTGGDRDDIDDILVKPEFTGGDRDDRDDILVKPELTGGDRDTPRHTDHIVDTPENEYNLAGGYTMPDIDIGLIDSITIINKDNVLEKVEEYLSNHNSNKFKTYHTKMEDMYKSLGKKFYLVRKNGSIYLMKSNDLKDNTISDETEGKLKYVSKITPPKIINIVKRLSDLNHLISSHKFNVDTMYNDIKKMTNTNARKDIIKIFEKKKANLIELLEEKESLKLYRIVVNNIDMKAEQIDVIYQHKLSDGTLEGSAYKIGIDKVNDINKVQSERLNNYQEIMTELNKYSQNSNKLKNDKNLIQKIKDYLAKDEVNEINKEIKININKQENYVDFVVAELPIF